MIEPSPEAPRYIHTAFAMDQKALEALRTLAEASITGTAAAREAALRRLPAGRADGPRTRLDLDMFRAARDRVLVVAPSGPIAETLRALSLEPRDVDGHAERALVARSHRLVRLVDIHAPERIVEGELELLHEAARALDRGFLRAEVDEHDPEAAVAFVSDRRFVLSLGGWATVLEILEQHLDELGAEPIPHVSELAVGTPLFPPPDFANPPKALFEEAIRDRGMWDEAHEREEFLQKHHLWLGWIIDEDDEGHTQTLDAWREAIASLDDSERKAIHASVESDGIGPTPKDWLVELEAAFVQIENARQKARDAGLMILARCDRSPY